MTKGGIAPAGCSCRTRAVTNTGALCATVGLSWGAFQVTSDSVQNGEDVCRDLVRARGEEVAGRDRAVRRLVVRNAPLHRGDDSQRPGGCDSGRRRRASRTLAASRPRNDYDVGIERVGHRDDRSKLRVRRRREQASDARRILPDLPRQRGLRHAMNGPQRIELIHDRVDLLDLTTRPLDAHRVHDRRAPGRDSGPERHQAGAG
jgi:hypothetical protein